MPSGKKYGSEQYLFMKVKDLNVKRCHNVGVIYSLPGTTVLLPPYKLTSSIITRFAIGKRSIKPYRLLQLEHLNALLFFRLKGKTRFNMENMD